MLEIVNNSDESLSDSNWHC